jgi:hypothetical protein
MSHVGWEFLPALLGSKYWTLKMHHADQDILGVLPCSS